MTVTNSTTPPLSRSLFYPETAPLSSWNSILFGSAFSVPHKWKHTVVVLYIWLFSLIMFHGSFMLWHVISFFFKGNESIVSINCIVGLLLSFGCYSVVVSLEVEFAFVRFLGLVCTWKGLLGHMEILCSISLRSRHAILHNSLVLCSTSLLIIPS